jgi:hypothetical protein
VGCCAEPSDAGYASGAAIAVSLAMAMVATGLMVRAVADLKRARADHARTQARYALDGAHLLAARRMADGMDPRRAAWSLSVPGAGSVGVLAEPESAKLGLEAAGQADPGLLSALGAREAVAASVALGRLSAATATPKDVEAADAGPVWRACAPSVISPWGLAQAPSLPRAGPPTSNTGVMRRGEVWRVVATTSEGWRDERIVRLVGRPERPATVIWRRISRRSDKDQGCGVIIDPT